MVAREADSLANMARLTHTMPESGGPALRHPKFDWKEAEKYRELCKIEIDARNIFITNNYNTKESRGRGSM